MIQDGWVDWAQKLAGPPQKVYATTNAGGGIVWHSMEGWWGPSMDELARPSRQASWMFSIDLSGVLWQHYPITASCWASGNSLANTQWWSVELEGTYVLPINKLQLATALRLIAEWSAWKGWPASRHGNFLYPPPLKTLWEHREVAQIAAPNVGPTACPSERYAPLWAALEDDAMTAEERELLTRLADLTIGKADGSEFATVAEALAEARRLGDNDTRILMGLGATQGRLADHGHSVAWAGKVGPAEFPE